MVTVAAFPGEVVVDLPPARDIAHLLLTRAGRDPKTGRPLLYASTDAHALRTYVDDTWDAQWKMTNGVRVWCIDRHNGSTIHLGGDYTWGNCEKVQETFEWLRDTSEMPARGRMVNGLNVQVVLVTDRAPWIKERLVRSSPKRWCCSMPTISSRKPREVRDGPFLAGTASNKLFYQRALDALFGKSRGKKPAMPKPRPGHTKRSCQPIAASTMPAADAPTLVDWSVPLQPTDCSGCSPKSVVPPTVEDGTTSLSPRSTTTPTASTTAQLAPPRLQQIGSGAMESLHRTGSQTRLKVAGIRCPRPPRPSSTSACSASVAAGMSSGARTTSPRLSLPPLALARSNWRRRTRSAAADAAETYQHAA
ncbi:MAG: hypothetical protein IPG17_28200 [Sandaracinaceae bacterium]|nr:hypothetical protein [Sandaracinaceae bacterium]